MAGRRRWCAITTRGWWRGDGCRAGRGSAWLAAGLGGRAGDGGRVRIGDGGVRADRTPVGGYWTGWRPSGGLPLVWQAREAEDLTWDKSDPKDAVVIARLAGQLRCYEPERTDATWARLRHLGARRARLVTEATAGVQQLRDLLDCVWPGVLDASASPFRSASWQASLAVVLDRAAGDLGRVRRLGAARFTAAVRAELPRWGASRPCLRIIRA